MELQTKSFYRSILVVILVLVSASQPAGAQTVQNAKDLRTALFTTNAYDKTVRPVADQSQVINVFVSFYLLAVNSLDEVGEVLTTTGYLYVYWTDDQLTWTPATYGNIFISFWPQSDIWKPDVALKNSAVPYKPLGDNSLLASVWSTGQVVWQPFQVFQSTCALEITNFPFDEQECELEFVAWSYTKSEVFMKGDAARGIDLQFFSGNPSWEVVNTSWVADATTTESSIKFIITLKRKPLFIILTIILPVMLLSILNIFTFSLPCEGGEKSGYAVTIFLALAVFLTIVQTTLPDNSENVAKFSIYVVMMAVMSTTITVIALVLSRIANWDENVHIIPGWLKKFNRIVESITITRFFKKRNKIHVETKSKLKKNKGSETDMAGVADGRDTDSETDSEKSSVEPECTWRDVVSSLDIICFIVFFLYAFLGNLLFLVSANSY